MTRPDSTLRSSSSIERDGEESVLYFALIWLAPTSWMRKEKRSKMTKVGVIQRGKHQSVLKFRAYVGQENHTTRAKAV